MRKDKTAALFGFSVKSGKLIYGLDNISQFQKKLHLVIICPTLSQNSKKDAAFICEKRQIPLIEPKEKLEAILFKQNCKAAALKDKQMAEAILKNTNENYRFIKFAEETT